MVLVSDKPMNFIVLNAPIVMVLHFLHTGRKRHTLPGTEEPMTTVELITALFYEVDEQLYAIPKHPEAHLWPSEVVTLGDRKSTRLNSSHSQISYAVFCSK